MWFILRLVGWHWFASVQRPVPWSPCRRSNVTVPYSGNPLWMHFNTYNSFQLKECVHCVLYSVFQNDLLTLKVNSQLHHLSIKCAIHVLHVNKFNPYCLRRRPADEVNPNTNLKKNNMLHIIYPSQKCHNTNAPLDGNKSKILHRTCVSLSTVNGLNNI